MATRCQRSLVAPTMPPMTTIAARLVVSIAIGVGVAAVPGCGCNEDEQRYEEPGSYSKSLVILGIDGMDPVLLEKFWAQGQLPHLKRLAHQGGFIPLGTSDPPQSPVAWSTFITGMNAGSHGIYDFVHRDPVKLEPYLSTSRTSAPSRTITVGSLMLPLGDAKIELLRRGQAFWQYLEEAGIPARVLKVPANFPPAETVKNPSMAGMGTPDLMGTYGTFQLLTNKSQFVTTATDGSVSGKPVGGGIVSPLRSVGHDDNHFSSQLVGPVNPMSTAGEVMTLEVSLVRDPKEASALIQFGDAELILREGEWSEWLPIEFDPGILGGAVPGMIRLYLGELSPEIRLYVSPINLDPLAPAMPLSSPSGYATTIAEDIGRFYTQGMPEETKALAAEVLSDDEFLAQAELVFNERLALLDHELAAYKGGLMFFYVSSVDQVSHVFWRGLEPDASPHDAAYAHVIPDVYKRVDDLVGRVLEAVGDNVPVIVMSDHGFASYRYKVNLNTWLAQQGYLTLRKGAPGPGALGHIDWTQTQAYALGLNQLFINLRGREAHGVVTAGEAVALRREIKRKLLLLRNPKNAARVVTQVLDVADVDRVGEFTDRAPDLIVGYNRGYRSSDESALGAVGDEIIKRNREKWSGDHCMDPSLVPGVLLSNVPLADIDNPNLADLAPTLLQFFGLELPQGLAHRSLLVGSTPKPVEQNTQPQPRTPDEKNGKKNGQDGTPIQGGR